MPDGSTPTPETSNDVLAATPAPRPGVVGVIVNPIAGKDIRRLSTGATHTPDTTKMGIVRRIVAAAAESGATELLLADDPHRLARRAIERLDLPSSAEVRLLSDHVRGSRTDTISAAAEMRSLGASVVLVLGGDGTCRDAATGWPDIPLIAISTGTNNVYPTAVDGTSAGVAAGLIASGAVDLDRVGQRTKRIVVHIAVAGSSTEIDDVALVDLALIDQTFVGARAVKEPETIKVVVAAIGEPGSTGLSSIAGRTHPIDRHVRGGVAITMAHHGDENIARRVRVPLSPGTFDTLDLADVRPIDDGEPFVLRGPGVLAFDGERDVPIGADAVVTATIGRSGPILIDVMKTLMLAANHERFDVASEIETLSEADSATSTSTSTNVSPERAPDAN
ncbi:MAG: NAD(+)/NADH kinase [Ilumatobacter sp.]|uniref:NAD(+)/NADH kinase n=1 Tax=Ilumatobacter sp. TaxID=1967498 RepID=UPI00391B9A2F